MPLFDQPVGRNGRNQKHDVAVLQACFMILRRSIKPAFWEGVIDGNWSAHKSSLLDGIEMLGRYMGLPEKEWSGPIDPGSDFTRLLQAHLPPHYQTLKGLPRSTCLVVSRPLFQEPKNRKLLDRGRISSRLYSDIKGVTAGMERRLGIPFSLMAIEAGGDEPSVYDRLGSRRGSDGRLFRFGADGYTFLNDDLSIGSSIGPFPQHVYDVFVGHIQGSRHLRKAESCVPRKAMQILYINSASPAKLTMANGETLPVSDVPLPPEGMMPSQGTEQLIDGCLYKEVGRQLFSRRGADEDVMRRAMRKVDSLLRNELLRLKYGALLAERIRHAPLPKKNFKFVPVKYDPRFMHCREESVGGTLVHVLRGLNTPDSREITGHTIMIFPYGLRQDSEEPTDDELADLRRSPHSEDQAIITYGHELWHLNPDEDLSDNHAEHTRYGEALLRLIKGEDETYTGPIPKWMEDEQQEK